MTMNSTISELVQDNSNVTTETNPIASVQSNELIFGQKHNDIDCALCPSAKRACDRAWVSAKNVEVWSKMSTTTLWRWLGKLEKARRIQSFSDMKKIKIDDENGRGHETTLNRRLHDLEECERISRLSDLINVDIPDENDHHGSGASVRQPFDMVLFNRSWRGSRIKQPKNVAPSP